MRIFACAALLLGVISSVANALPDLSAMNRDRPKGQTDIQAVTLNRESDRWEVAVKASRPLSFSGQKISEGHRFFVDFYDSWLSTGESTLALNREGITVRAAQFSYDPPIVRVVVQAQDGVMASLSTAAPSSQAVIVIPGASHARPLTRIEVSTYTPSARDFPPRRSVTPSRSRLTSRGGRFHRPNPDEVFHPDTLEAFDEPPVPSDGGSLLPVIAADLPDTIMTGVKAAMSGNRHYVWGGETPSGFDCSGMQQFIYRFAGISLPRTAAEQFKAGTPVESADLQPGDLIFFSNGKRVFHVGMYIGNGRMFHAANPKRGLTTDLLNETFYANHYAGARRYSN